jgi:hypothetical protein
LVHREKQLYVLAAFFEIRQSQIMVIENNSTSNGHNENNHFSINHQKSYIPPLLKKTYYGISENQLKNRKSFYDRAPIQAGVRQYPIRGPIYDFMVSQIA